MEVAGKKPVTVNVSVKERGWGVRMTGRRPDGGGRTGTGWCGHGVSIDGWGEASSGSGMWVKYIGRKGIVPRVSKTVEAVMSVIAIDVILVVAIVVLGVVVVVIIATIITAGGSRGEGQKGRPEHI